MSQIIKQLDEIFKILKDFYDEDVERIVVFALIERHNFAIKHHCF